MVDKFDFYDFNQQRDKVHNLKSLELEYKLNIDTISEEGKKQIKLGDDLTKPDTDDRFEKEQYLDDKDKILKKLQQLKTELEEVKVKKTENEEQYLQEKEDYHKVIVESFSANFQILQKLVDNTLQTTSDVSLNQKDLNTMEKLLHNWQTTFGQLELQEITSLGDTELTFIDNTTKQRESLIEEFTQIIDGQIDKESVLLLDNIKFLLRNNGEKNVCLLEKIEIIDMFTLSGILLLCIIVYLPGMVFLLGTLLYYSYPFEKKRTSNYCLVNENQFRYLNNIPSEALDIVKVNSFELSLVWGLLSSYLAYSLFYV